MSAATVQDLLAHLTSPTVMRPDATVKQVPLVYPSGCPPTDEQLRALKEQLSADVWLYLLRAEEVGLPLDQPLVRRELQAHLARVLDLVGQDLRNEPLNSPQVLLRCQWVQHQLLHAPTQQLPPVYYERAVRSLVAEAQLQQAQDQAWNALSPEQQAAYAQELAQRLSTTRPSVTIPSHPIPLAPRTSFSGGLQHPGFGEWLVQELAQRPLPEIEPYLILTWVLARPEAPRRAGEARRVFAPDDIPYLLDLLDSDWSFLTTGGRPQLARARDWFARHQSASPANTKATLSKQAQLITDQPKSPLSLRQLALCAIYEGSSLPLQKANDVAREWGYESGGRLYQLYRGLLRPSDRLGRESRQLTSLIKDIEAVLSHLTDSARKRAEDELVELNQKK
ncbi:hypothetical protein MTX78_19705 [Hymenobacter tibetensis]|uniref:Uncharacterized protein n=1 Tax=Hymenobacter tibetensis TaxID=497967 RepID=A0ABY4CVM8_9BACT|nr:hypothetical protein [Hymenobacter tibetensis]UOG74331.1 hypothetical protein MTX78_19705 [Hymenobacter tibetensis]